MSLFLVDKPSALLENAVGICLKRKYEDGVYYFKSNQTGIDIDFYIPDEGMAVQVAYALGDAQERETKSLISLAKKTEGVKRQVIVTSEEERTIEDDGYVIEVIPVHKFLLS